MQGDWVSLAGARLRFQNDIKRRAASRIWCRLKRAGNMHGDGHFLRVLPHQASLALATLFWVKFED